MIKIHVKANLKELQDWIKDIAGNQLPFITAKTLTDLATKTKAEQVKALAQTFTLRNSYVANSFRTVMAKKKDWPNQEAVVGSIFDPMELQETGGNKKAKDGGDLGIPFEARPNKGVIIPKSKWIRRVMGEPHIYPFTSIRGRYKGRTFLLQWHPTGKRRGRPRGVKNGDKKPLQGRHKAYYTSTYKRKDGTVGRRLKPNPSVLYEITHQVRIKPKLGLRERSTRVVAQSYEEKFKTNLNSALKEKNKNK